MNNTICLFREIKQRYLFGEITNRGQWMPICMYLCWLWDTACHILNVETCCMDQYSVNLCHHITSGLPWNMPNPWIMLCGMTILWHEYWNQIYIPEQSRVHHRTILNVLLAPYHHVTISTCYGPFQTQHFHKYHQLEQSHVTSWGNVITPLPQSSYI